MKTKTWTVIANTGKQADLESGLEKKTVQKPTYISPEILLIGWRLKAALMTPLCNHYLSGKNSSLSTNSPFCTRKLPHARNPNFCKAQTSPQT
jgi:hypothetical protein